MVENFVRSGSISINRDDKSLGYVDIIGWNWSHKAMTWSSVTSESTAADDLRFTTSTDVSVNPSNGPSIRFIAFPLRCLSTAVEGEERAYNFLQSC